MSIPSLNRMEPVVNTTYPIIPEYNNSLVHGYTNNHNEQALSYMHHIKLT